MTAQRRSIAGFRLSMAGRGSGKVEISMETREQPTVREAVIDLLRRFHMMSIFANPGVSGRSAVARRLPAMDERDSASQPAAPLTGIMIVLDKDLCVRYCAGGTSVPVVRQNQGGIMKEKGSLAFVALAGGLFLFAASGSANSQEIRLWTLNFANDSGNQGFLSIIKQFETANPGITVKVEPRGVDEHKSALRVAAGSDQAPDIFFSWAGLGLGGEFVKSGLAAPMDKYYAQYKWDEVFLPAALSFSRQYTGGRFGVPYTFHGEALYYNKALFAKAGIANEPKTYDELVADADKLAAVHVPAIAFGGTVNWHVMRLMDELLETQCGPAKHDALMTMKTNWAEEPCATKSFEELHKWTSKYFLKPFMGIDQAQSFNLFLAGRAAMMLEGDWLVGQLKQADKLADYGMFTFPGTTRLYGFAEYNYISSKSKNPDIAAKFLDYLESTPVQQAHLGDFGTISVNKNVKLTSTEPLDLAWAKAFASFSDTFVNGDQAFPLTVTTEYFRVINQVASDNLDPAKAAAELQKFIAGSK